MDFIQKHRRGIMVALVVAIVLACGALYKSIQLQDEPTTAGDSSWDYPAQEVKTDVADEPEREAMYYASDNSDVFHEPGCRWVKKIKDYNLVSYDSYDEAVDDGKRPCKTCNP